MATIKINDVDDARFVAKHYGFTPSNEGQRGAFPVKQLAEHLGKYGHNLDLSEYVSSATTRVDPSYLVTTLVKDGDNIRVEYANIALSEVRELTGKTGRGRPGYMDIINATVARDGWTPVSNSKNAFDVTQL